MAAIITVDVRAIDNMPEVAAVGWSHSKCSGRKIVVEVTAIAFVEVEAITIVKLKSIVVVKVAAFVVVEIAANVIVS